jgi:hypothetical protein
MFQKIVDGAFKSPTTDEAIVRCWSESDQNWLSGIDGYIAKEFSYGYIAEEFSYEKTKTRSFDPFAPKVE